MAAVFPKRKITVFFDVDNTLIDFDSSVRRVRWLSGSAKRWQCLCCGIQKLGEKHKFEAKERTDAGIALKGDDFESPDNALSVISKTLGRVL